MLILDFNCFSDSRVFCIVSNATQNDDVNSSDGMSSIHAAANRALSERRALWLLHLEHPHVQQPLPSLVLSEEGVLHHDLTGQLFGGSDDGLLFLKHPHWKAVSPA